jgi:hypothetical protein
VENRANESGNGRRYKERGKGGLFIGASYLEKKVVFPNGSGAGQSASDYISSEGLIHCTISLVSDPMKDRHCTISLASDPMEDRLNQRRKYINCP